VAVCEEAAGDGETVEDASGADAPVDDAADGVDDCSCGLDGTVAGA
jgi:hypothetical protein